MPQWTAWSGSRTGYNPFVGLETATHRAFGYAAKVGQKRLRDEADRLADKQARIEDVYAKRKRDYLEELDPGGYKRARAERYNKKMVRRAPSRYRRRRIARRRPVRRPYVRARRMLPRPERGIKWGRMVELKMTGGFQLHGAAGALASLLIKANSLADPLGASGTSLPRYVDQWAALYQKYKVFGSTLVVNGHTLTTTGAGISGVSLRSSGTAETTWIEYKEQKFPVVQRLLSSDLDLFKFGMSYKPKKFWHITKMKDEDNQEGVLSTTPTDPTDLCYYHIYTQDLDQTQDTTTQITYEVRYLVFVYDPVDVAASSL